MGLMLLHFTVNDPAEKKVSDKTVCVISELIILWPEVYMGNCFDTNKTVKIKQKISIVKICTNLLLGAAEESETTRIVSSRG